MTPCGREVERSSPTVVISARCHVVGRSSGHGVIADAVMWICGQGDTMKIVAVICQKGGVGKTCVSVHLATASALAGHRTAIVDLDPQGTASSWGDLRQADEPEVISGQAARLPMLIEAARANGADLILIDTPPQADTIALTAAKVADIVLVPIRPAIWDLQAAQPSLLLAQVANRPAFIVLNGVRPGSNIGNEAAAGLIGQGAQVAPVMLRQRVQYEYAVRDGRTVMETYPNETAAEEVAQLYQWLCGRVDMPTRGQACEAA
jgi:chromosome partitioning protein